MRSSRRRRETWRNVRSGQASGIRNRVVALKTRAAIRREAARRCFEKGKKKKSRARLRDTMYVLGTGQDGGTPQPGRDFSRGIASHVPIGPVRWSQSRYKQRAHGGYRGTGDSVAFVTGRAVLEEDQECAGTGGCIMKDIYIRYIYSCASRFNETKLRRVPSGLLVRLRGPSWRALGPLARPLSARLDQEYDGR